MDLLQWDSVKIQNEYRFDLVTAAFLLQNRLGTSSRWYHLELRTGLIASQLVGVFWKLVELVSKKYGRFLQLLPGLLFVRSEQHAQATVEESFSFYSCVEVIYSTRLRINRPGGLNRN